MRTRSWQLGPADVFLTEARTRWGDVERARGFTKRSGTPEEGRPGSGSSRLVFLVCVAGSLATGPKNARSLTRG